MFGVGQFKEVQSTETEPQGEMQAEAEAEAAPGDVEDSSSEDAFELSNEDEEELWSASAGQTAIEALKAKVDALDRSKGKIDIARCENLIAAGQMPMGDVYVEGASVHKVCLKRIRAAQTSECAGTIVPAEQFAAFALNELGKLVEATPEVLQHALPLRSPSAPSLALCLCLCLFVFVCISLYPCVAHKCTDRSRWLLQWQSTATLSRCCVWPWSTGWSLSGSLCLALSRARSRSLSSPPPPPSVRPRLCLFVFPSLSPRVSFMYCPGQVALLDQAQLVAVHAHRVCLCPGLSLSPALSPAPSVCLALSPFLLLMLLTGAGDLRLVLRSQGVALSPVLLADAAADIELIAAAAAAEETLFGTDTSSMSPWADLERTDGHHKEEEQVLSWTELQQAAAATDSSDGGCTGPQGHLAAAALRELVASSALTGSSAGSSGSNNSEAGGGDAGGKGQDSDALTAIHTGGLTLPRKAFESWVRCLCDEVFASAHSSECAHSSRYVSLCLATRLTVQNNACNHTILSDC